MKDIIKHLIPDSLFLKNRFKKIMGYPLDLKNPQTFNEKLQWLKLHVRKPIYTTMVDKYEVKMFVAGLIGNEYIIPTLGVWDSFDEIDFNKLPNQFVLKCTHDSGSYIVCDDKSTIDLKMIKKKLQKCLNKNYFWDSREWPYKKVIPRIIAEKYIGYFPKDYKFFVFNGKIDSVMICTGRENGHPKFYFYDQDWNRLYYQRDELEMNDNIEKPLNFDKMKEVVLRLACNFTQIRIDLYNVEGKIYFGEYTLYNQSGFDTDISYDTDVKWGKLVNIKKTIEDML